jgi:flagellar motor switch protein FliG
MLPPGEVAEVLLDENEQVCAIALSAMKPTAAARVLESFPAERRMSVLTRVAKSIPPRREVLDSIAGSLIARLAPAAPKVRQEVVGVASAAQIMNYLTQETETALIEAMQGSDEQLFTSIDEKRVTMDDLTGIDKKAMQKILAGVDTRVLIACAKGASREVDFDPRQRLEVLRETILRNATCSARCRPPRSSSRACSS